MGAMAGALASGCGGAGVGARAAAVTVVEAAGMSASAGVEPVANGVATVSGLGTDVVGSTVGGTDEGTSIAGLAGSADAGEGSAGVGTWPNLAGARAGSSAGSNFVALGAADGASCRCSGSAKTCSEMEEGTCVVSCVVMTGGTCSPGSEVDGPAPTPSSRRAASSSRSSSIACDTPDGELMGSSPSGEARTLSILNSLPVRFNCLPLLLLPFSALPSGADAFFLKLPEPEASSSRADLFERWDSFGDFFTLVWLLGAPSSASDGAFDFDEDFDDLSTAALPEFGEDMPLRAVAGKGCGARRRSLLWSQFNKLAGRGNLAIHSSNNNNNNYTQPEQNIVYDTTCDTCDTILWN